MDDEGGVGGAATQATVIVNNVPPTHVDGGGPYYGLVGQPVHLTSQQTTVKRYAVFLPIVIRRAIGSLRRLNTGLHVPSNRSETGVLHSPRILTSTRLRRRPSNSP